MGMERGFGDRSRKPASSSTRQRSIHRCGDVRLFPTRAGALDDQSHTVNRQASIAVGQGDLRVLQEVSGVPVRGMTEDRRPRTTAIERRELMWVRGYCQVAVSGSIP